MFIVWGAGSSRQGLMVCCFECQGQVKDWNVGVPLSLG